MCRASGPLPAASCAFGEASGLHRDVDGARAFDEDIARYGTVSVIHPLI